MPAKTLQKEHLRHFQKGEINLVARTRQWLARSMQEAARRFIDLATQPMENAPDLRKAAENELEQATMASDPQRLAEAADALAKADTRPHRRKWLSVLYVSALVVSLPMLVGEFRLITRFGGISSLLLQWSQVAPAPRTNPNLTSDQNLLLNGDPAAASAAERWKPLWQSDSDNPTYLAEYAAAYFSDHKQLAPEISEAANRVDPDNGWYLALAVAEISDGAVTKEKRSEQEIAADKTAVLTIHDEQRLEKSLAMLHQLAGKPSFTSYLTALHRERLVLFPPRRDFISQIPLIGHAASTRSSGIPIRKFADLWAAGAQQCAEKRDVVGFQQLIADWHAFVVLSAKNSETLVDMLVTKVIMMGPAPHFRDAAQTLGLEDDVQYFQRLADYNKAETKRRKQHSDEDDSVFRSKSSLLGGLLSPMLARQVHSPPPLTDEDLRPGRYADHAFFARLLSSAGWLLFGSMALFAIIAGCHHSRLTWRLSVRMLDLFRPSDWLLLFSGGVALPVSWYMIISRMTPLAAREWSVAWLNFVPCVGQLSVLLGALIAFPVFIASYLFAKRADVLQSGSSSSWPGWVGAVVILSAMPLFGALPYFRPSGMFALPLAIAVFILILLMGILTLRYRKDSPLRMATIGRMTVPVWILAMLVMALSMRFHYAEERHWIQRDRIGEITSESPAISHYEHMITEAMRKEISENLGKLP